MDAANTQARATSWPSRIRLLAGVRRLRVSEIATSNQVLRCPPLVLSDGRIFIWQDPGRIAPTAELVGRCGSAPIAIAADGLAQIEPRLEGFESFVPTDTCAALVEHALHPVISMLERAAGTPIEFDELRRGRQASLLDDMVDIGFVIYERNLTPTLRGCVRAPSDAWRGFEFGRVSALSTRRHLAVPVRMNVQIGALRLLARELASLAPGEALRACSRVPARSDALPVLLTDAGGRPLLRAVVAGHTLTMEENVTTAAEFSADAQRTEGGAEAGEPAADVLAEIECEVTFELGSIRMTVADVARLRAGQAIRLGVRLQDQPVRVMVNGRPIGRGELAALGDEMVVVLTDTARLPHV